MSDAQNQTSPWGAMICISHFGKKWRVYVDGQGVAHMNGAEASAILPTSFSGDEMSEVKRLAEEEFAGKRATHA